MGEKCLHKTNVITKYKFDGPNKLFSSIMINVYCLVITYTWTDYRMGMAISWNPDVNIMFQFLIILSILVK